MLVVEREDPAAPRRRGGVVVRERDLPLGQDDMASKVNERMGEGYGEKFQLQRLKSLKARKRIEQIKYKEDQQKECTRGAYT